MRFQLRLASARSGISAIRTVGHVTGGFPQAITDQDTVPGEPRIHVLIGEGAQAEIALVDQRENEPGRTRRAEVVFSELGFDFKLVLRSLGCGKRVELRPQLVAYAECARLGELL